MSRTQAMRCADADELAFFSRGEKAHRGTTETVEVERERVAGWSIDPRELQV